MNVTSNFDIVAELMAGLNFQQPVESFVILTPQEKANLADQSGWVTKEKLLTIYKWSDVPKEYHENFEKMFVACVAFEKAFGYRLCWRSVFRSWAHHLRVYATINAQRKIAGLDPLEIPTASNHLYMLAFDCAPVDKPISFLHDFVRDEKVLKQLNLWAEALKFTPTWFHGQLVQYRSWTPEKSRFFNIK